MKIEIDKSYVDGLESSNQQLEKRLKDYETESYNLGKEKQLDRTMELSRWLFESYCRAVFMKLGFDYTDVQINLNSLRYKLSKDWFSPQYQGKLEVEIGSTITTKFRQAILKVGINEDLIKDESKNEELKEWDFITYKENENNQ